MSHIWKTILFLIRIFILKEFIVEDKEMYYQVTASVAIFDVSMVEKKS